MSLYSWKEELKDKKVFIWGASIGGNQAFECLAKNGIPVEAYCDNDEQKWCGGGGTMENKLFLLNHCGYSVIQRVL